MQLDLSKFIRFKAQIAFNIISNHLIINVFLNLIFI